MNHLGLPMPILRDAAYPITLIDEILGGRAATRSARRRNISPLKIRRTGRKSFVLGKDFLEYLEASPTVDSEGIPRDSD